MRMSTAKTPPGMTSRCLDWGLAGSSLGPTSRKSSLYLTRYEPLVTLPKKPVFLSSSTLLRPELACMFPSAWRTLSSYVDGSSPRPSGFSME